MLTAVQHRLLVKAIHVLFESHPDSWVSVILNFNRQEEKCYFFKVRQQEFECDMYEGGCRDPTLFRTESDMSPETCADMINYKLDSNNSILQSLTITVQGVQYMLVNNGRSKMNNLNRLPNRSEGIVDPLMRTFNNRNRRRVGWNTIVNDTNNRLSNRNNDNRNYFSEYRNTFLDDQRRRGANKKKSTPLKKWLALQKVNKSVKGNKNLMINAGNMLDVVTQNLPTNARKALYIVDNVSKGKIHGVYEPESLYELIVAGNGRSPVSRKLVTQVRRVPPQIAAKILEACGIRRNRKGDPKK